MGVVIQFWGDAIQPGDKPVFIFPLIQGYLKGQTRDPTNTANNLVSSLSGIVLTGSDSAGSVNLDQVGNAANTEAGLIVGPPHEDPSTGQVANLTVQTSKNGKALQNGVGVLAEIGASGIYSYTLDSTETQEPGSLLVAVEPINPKAITDVYIYPAFLNCRIMKPGIPITKVTRESILEALTGPNSPFSNLENYINQAIRDLLGNQMTTKPTFRRDS